MTERPNASLQPRHVVADPPWLVRAATVCAAAGMRTDGRRGAGLLPGGEGPEVACGSPVPMRLATAAT